MPQGSRYFSLLVPTVRSFFRSNQTPLLQSVTSSSPFLSPSSCLSLFFFLSLSIFLVFGVSLVPPPSSDSLRRIFSLRSSVRFHFSRSSLQSCRALRLPRSYRSFVSLVISSYGRVSASFSDPHLASSSHGSISPAQILWKVSVLFLLAL